MKAKPKILLILGLILLTVIILKLLSKHFIPNDNGFFINLTTEILGAVITFIAIDNVITSNENRKINEYQKIAFRALSNPLRNYVSLWLHIGFESEEKAKLELTNISLKELFLSDKFVENIKAKDFDDYYNNMIIRGQQDSRILKDIFPKSYNGFKKELNFAIGKYASFYEYDTLYLLEHFAEKSHLYETFDFWIQLNGGNHSKWFQPDILKKEYFHQHFTRLFTLIDSYNAVIEIENQINKDSFLSFKKFDDYVEY